MNHTKRHDTSELQEATRLMIGNLPYSLEKAEFAEVFARIAKLDDVYLSKPKSANQKNGGWGIISLDEPAARNVLDQTILIGDRVARIKRARPKGE